MCPVIAGCLIMCMSHKQSQCIVLQCYRTDLDIPFWTFIMWTAGTEGCFKSQTHPPSQLCLRESFKPCRHLHCIGSVLVCKLGLTWTRSSLSHVLVWGERLAFCHRSLWEGSFHTHGPSRAVSFSFLSLFPGTHVTHHMYNNLQHNWPKHVIQKKYNNFTFFFKKKSKNTTYLACLVLLGTELKRLQANIATFFKSGQHWAQGTIL